MMPGKKLLVIEHDHLSPLGPVAERFVDRGYDVIVHRVVPADSHDHPGVTTTFPSVVGFDAVVSMGARWSTYDVDLVGSWVIPEIELLLQADDVGVPVLGICFGGQLLAAAHGGAVVRSSSPEIGWTSVASDDAGLVSEGPWFHWHFDRWEVPPLASELARNSAASQAFVLRRNLAVQFHPEMTSGMLAGWLGNGGAELLEREGYDVDALAATTTSESSSARRRAHTLVDGFLDRVAPSEVGDLHLVRGS